MLCFFDKLNIALVHAYACLGDWTLNAPDEDHPIADVAYLLQPPMWSVLPFSFLYAAFTTSLSKWILAGKKVTMIDRTTVLSDLKCAIIQNSWVTPISLLCQLIKLLLLRSSQSFLASFCSSFWCRGLDGCSCIKRKCFQIHFTRWKFKSTAQAIPDSPPDGINIIHPSEVCDRCWQPT